MGRYSPTSKTNHHDDEFDVSEDELRLMARALEVDERRRGQYKHLERHQISISQFCRLMEEADTRRRSRNVGVYRDRHTGRFGIGERNQRGSFRKRMRRTRKSRSRQGYDRAGREKQHSQRQLHRKPESFQSQQRKLYNQSLRNGEDLTLSQAEVLLEDDMESSEDELEIIELQAPRK